ncbi:MAG: aminotransferase class III-fold pyridoxal phosphate-dependent enzyme [Myxococcales bacterium]|nr:aminotransferase class III-fold pyridoxal phosphate-dependent enzyme [Myxococcales bacterium]MCB9643617.1 aminotransferase class III-fold pyridoxal phosphate-dependent enzyme [Myxococcales bacterium]
MIELCKKHTMYSWSANEKVNPTPVARAEGIYFWTPDGKRFIDFNSQLMSVNIGHSHPKVIAGMKAALDRLGFVYPGTATEPRARLGAKLASLMPGDLNTFFFTLGGADANENAVRAARFYTGRQKILCRYRSYHGGTNATMQMSGDPRRWPNEPGMPGVVHVMDPRPYNYSFGKTEAEITSENLKYLEEVITYEGSHTIAAMFIETVTGTNGILPPPEGYLKGLHELLQKYGILLVCDEVMAGWGRTGRLFAFEHGGIVPDIVTMAKGLTSSYAPLGCMAVRDPIAKHFQDHVFWGGLTYNAHPFLLETALTVIEVFEEEGILENVVRMERVMRSEMDRMIAKHPSAKEGRCIGLFGMMDLQKNRAGEPMAPFNGTSPAMQALAKFFNEEGLFTFMRWGSFMCNPPLCITEEQIRESFEIIDRGLDITDQFVED